MFSYFVFHSSYIRYISIIVKKSFFQNKNVYHIMLE